MLQRAKLYDPSGMRTLAVLTKPDLVDPGSENEMIEVLMNRRVSLMLGFCMVKLRGQKELDECEEKDVNSTELTRRATKLMGSSEFPTSSLGSLTLSPIASASNFRQSRRK